MILFVFQPFLFVYVDYNARKTNEAFLSEGTCVFNLFKYPAPDK